MAFDADYLRKQLSRLAADGAAARLVVGYSGGMDSSVLLHTLASLRDGAGADLLAVHVNHGLHADAADWERHCRGVAADLQLEYRSVTVEVPRNSGHGLEAAARERRYAALAATLAEGDWLLSAHHRDDQAETLLLNLLRGSGVAGLAGIAGKRPLGRGHLVRPLLAVSRRELQDYAEEHRLRWLADPSNSELQFDRNFLRSEVLPVLGRRWPATAARLARSAALAGEANSLLNELADMDAPQQQACDRLAVAELADLSDARQRNLLRRIISRCDFAPAPETRLRQIIDELVTAKADAEPVVRWADVEVHRYRDRIYIHAALPDTPPPVSGRLGAGISELALGGLGSLHLIATGSDAPPRRLAPIHDDIVAQGLSVRFRAGGEALVPSGHNTRQKLKKLFQQRGIVPWMREKIPLLYAGDNLVAVADLWVAAEFSAERGSHIEWRNHPAIS